MRTDRLRMDMTMKDIVMAMSDGNPGAINVLMGVMLHGERIDPNSFAGRITPIFDMDSQRIYGPRIWMLFKDVCGESLEKMLAVLRACQLGGLAGCTQEAIGHAIDNSGEGIDADAALAAVQKRLPRFADALSRTAKDATEGVEA